MKNMMCPNRKDYDDGMDVQSGWSLLFAKKHLSFYASQLSYIISLYQ